MVQYLKNIYHFADDLLRRMTWRLRKRPSFIVIGVQKGGSSSLYHYMMQHPLIKSPWRKELRYFDLRYDNGDSWYQSRFPLNRGKYITGEASPDYFFHPDVPVRIRKYDPNIKLIVVLRDPVERAYSHFQMELRKGREAKLNFEEAIEYELNHLREVEIDSFDFKYHTYLKRGKYGEQLQRWLSIFERDQILVLNSDDFFKDPQAELNKMCDFLKVPNFTPMDLSPRNVGNYTSPVSDVLKQRMKAYYEHDLALLKNYISWEVRWFG